MTLLFSSSSVIKSVKGIALQDPKVHGARLPEDLFRAQEQEPRPWLLLCLSVAVHLPGLSQTFLDWWNFKLCVYINHWFLSGWRQTCLSVIYTICFPSLKCWFLTGQTAEWYLASVNYWLVVQYYVQFLQQIKMQNKNSCVVESANSFCWHKLLETGHFFLPAHLTLPQFCFLGRKDILWLHFQMARRIIVPLGFINQAFGFLGNTFFRDW